jgi:hypothetical protein
MELKVQYLNGFAMAARFLKDGPEEARGFITAHRILRQENQAWGELEQAFMDGRADAYLAAFGLGDEDGARVDSHCSGCSLCDGYDRENA